MNNGFLVAESRKLIKPRYFALENSPLSMCEAQTGKVMMDALTGTLTNRCIVERFNFDELCKIIELPINIQFF